jgi:hypothetical protein
LRYTPILIALAVSFPLACNNGGSGDGGPGGCGGTQEACATITDCCPGFECSASKCVFVGGGNGNGNGGSSSNAGGSSSSAGSSAGGTHGSGTSSGGATTGHGTSGGGTTGHANNGSGGGTSSGGATSGFSPDLCAACESVGNCTGPNDLCVCDPTDPFCDNGGYCAGSCGTGSQALCPSGTDCVSAVDAESDGEDFVCYPESETCVPGGTSSGGSTNGGGTSGGNSGGDLCSVCGVFISTTPPVPTPCPTTSNLCACDPDDSMCIDGFCAASCSVAGADAGDQALCPKGTTCTPTVDWQTLMIQYFVCYPSDGTCLDAGT